MKPTIHLLDSADQSVWKDSVSSADKLPIRDSGAWIETKHKLLTYCAGLFATGMKNAWKSRVYLELFSGPGRCLIRKTGKEDLGSPLKVIEHEFTKFNCIGQEVLITTDTNTPLYLLLFASKHPKGKEFWAKAMKGVLPMEFDFGS